MKRLLILYVFFTGLGAAKVSQKSLIFLRNGQEVRTLSKQDFASQSFGLKEQAFTVYHPGKKSEKKWVGYVFEDLLGEVYGTSWKKALKIRFKALDGYVQVSKLTALLPKMSQYKGVVAYKLQGKKNLGLVKRRGKKVSAEPFYLLWSGFSVGDKNYKGSLKWPYQLIQIDLIFEDKK